MHPYISVVILKKKFINQRILMLNRVKSVCQVETDAVYNIFIQYSA